MNTPSRPAQILRAVLPVAVCSLPLAVLFVLQLTDWL